jgi:hypothetical protein
MGIGLPLQEATSFSSTSPPFLRNALFLSLSLPLSFLQDQQRASSVACFPFSQSLCSAGLESGPTLIPFPLGSVWGWTGLLQYQSIPKPQKNILKINSNILTFYIISITFYHFSNKKNHYKIKNFIFLYKTFLLFSSHQSNPLQYQSTSSNPVHS